jgi:hypothetical protein
LICLSDDLNFNTKETKKLSTYKDLDIQVSSMWKVRTKIAPVIFGALGTVKKGLDQTGQP